MFKRQVEMEKMLRDWSQKMLERFIWLCIRFEYNKERGVYLISFSPSEKIDESEDFCREALAFEDRMNALYGDDAPLFCDEERCFKLSEQAEEIKVYTKAFRQPRTVVLNWSICQTELTTTTTEKEYNLAA